MQTIMTTIALNLQQLHHRVQQACQRAGRDPAGVTLLAVSKTFDADAVADAVAAGQRQFGENYVQEGVDKVLALRQSHPGVPLVWHCIGPLQANKTRPVAEHFDWVQTIDRLKIAQRLSDARPSDLPPLNICLQVNISEEASKSGASGQELLELALNIKQLPHLRLRGLMAIPAPCSDFEQQRDQFRQVRALFDQLNNHGLQLDTLSIGMSGDFVAAIAEGATLVRIGTAIFGARTSSLPTDSVKKGT